MAERMQSERGSYQKKRLSFNVCTLLQLYLTVEVGKTRFSVQAIQKVLSIVNLLFLTQVALLNLITLVKRFAKQSIKIQPGERSSL